MYALMIPFWNLAEYIPMLVALEQKTSISGKDFEQELSKYCKEYKTKSQDIPLALADGWNGEKKR